MWYGLCLLTHVIALSVVLLCCYRLTRVALTMPIVHCRSAVYRATIDTALGGRGML